MFVTVPWAHDDDITEVKLDQMIDNDAHVRAEAEFKPLVTATLFNNLRNQESGSPTPAIAVAIDGTGEASFSGTGSKAEPDIDVSALSDGIHELRVTLSPTFGNSSGACYYKFFKTADLQRITVFARMYSHFDANSTTSFVRADVTIIGHRVNQAWTA